MRYIISAGGTGGHIYPALALADTIIEKDPSCEVFDGRRSLRPFCGRRDTVRFLRRYKTYNYCSGFVLRFVVILYHWESGFLFG